MAFLTIFSITGPIDGQVCVKYCAKVRACPSSQVPVMVITRSTESECAVGYFCSSRNLNMSQSMVNIILEGGVEMESFSL